MATKPVATVPAAKNKVVMIAVRLEIHQDGSYQSEVREMTDQTWKTIHDPKFPNVGRVWWRGTIEAPLVLLYVKGWLKQIGVLK